MDKQIVLVTEKDTEDRNYFFNHLVEMDKDMDMEKVLKKALELYRNDDRVEQGLENPTKCLEKAIEMYGGRKVRFSQYEWLV